LLLDLNQRRSQHFAADICVVGTGAAGLTLASVFLRAGASVIMLESGGAEPEAQAQRLNRCETDQLLFEGAYRGRKRVYGGSTVCWGGQLLPLEPIDFAPRPWVDHSGWPITADDLAPYYRQALKFAGSDELNFDSDVCRRLAIDSPFDPEILRYYFSKWSPRPRFRDIIADDLRQSEGVRVFLHANVTRLELGDRGRHVREVRACNASGEEFVFTSSVVVLCAGGIETARLLLTNRHRAPHGIGNGLGLVGRFFQDHPSLTVGTVRSADSGEMQKYFGTSKVDGREVSPRLSLSPEVQETYGLLNASAYMSFGYPPTLLRRAMVLNLARRLGAEPRAARNLIDAASTLVRPTVRMRRQGFRVGKDAQFALTVVTEQEPCPESRITLSNRTDRFGVPRARISWRATDKTWTTVSRFSHILRAEFRRAGLADVALLPHITTPKAYWRVFPHDMYHHMGATRMGTSPETGVVNEDCRVFGVDNLFVASSSVFPTGGHSNCTLTIMALALRLADHLRVSPREA
jgi:choline dehydrogenase-like flavoprotein